VPNERGRVLARGLRVCHGRNVSNNFIGLKTELWKTVLAVRDVLMCFYLAVSLASVISSERT
jgi:hypothetical protein